jgi:hypothetical protein
MIPSIGRIVHYVLDSGPSQGQHRPAIVVETFPAVSAGNPPAEDAILQLNVFTDGPNDGSRGPVLWRSRISRDEERKAPGTWHEPEKV